MSLLQLRVLVIGSGGREHAFCRSIAASPSCAKLFCAPGNPGIAAFAECLPVAVDDIAKIVRAAKEHAIDFVVIGPEVPLSLGLADELFKEGIACFGPTKAAAEIESSKGFMKDLCTKAGVPTAKYRRFKDADAAKTYVTEEGAPVVIKADGLAAGKGVVIAATISEAHMAIDDMMVSKIFGDAGASIVVEEFMEGEEASFFALCDGKVAIPFAAAQDHKAVFDGDKGPNTGGMGAYSPAPVVDQDMSHRIMQDIIEPTMTTMAEMGRPFAGVLFAGLMITKTGPRLIEFNARFGDPETQAMLPRLKSDFLQLVYMASSSGLENARVEFLDRAALCVVMAADGYPATYQKGSVIGGLDQAAKIPDTFIYHAGTARNASGDIVASGGRVLGVCGWGASIKEAKHKAYSAVDDINWPEGFCRRDIGWRAVAREESA